MSLTPIAGRVAWVFTEENFDVDQIVGVKNIKITDVAELAKIAMHAYDPAFAADVRPGDVVVGAGNFGYGHPHYPPLRALRHLGISAVIAESFSPGFWRGEISMGMPLIACPESWARCSAGTRCRWSGPRASCATAAPAWPCRSSRCRPATAR